MVNLLRGILSRVTGPINPAEGGSRGKMAGTFSAVQAQTHSPESSVTGAWPGGKIGLTCVTEGLQTTRKASHPGPGLPLVFPRGSGSHSREPGCLAQQWESTGPGVSGGSGGWGTGAAGPQTQGPPLPGDSLSSNPTLNLRVHVTRQGGHGCYQSPPFR